MWTTYLVFLAIYATFKYLAVPGAAAAFDPVYIRSTAVVTTMTGILPFGLTWLAVRSMPNRRRATVVGVLLAIGLCIAGYAGFWYFFIPADPSIRPPLWAVARRGFLPGAVQGAIILLGLRRLAIARGNVQLGK